VRYLRWQFGSRLLGFDMIVPFVDDAVLVIGRGMTGATGNLYVGLDEYRDMGFVLHVLRPGDLFVDVGSNVGSYTILAATAGAEVLAFEPVPQSFDRLCRNVRVNGFTAKADCRSIAVGAAAGRLHITSTADTMNHVATESDSRSETVEIAVDSLDAQLAGTLPAVVKVDVEGFEMQVIEGGQGTLGNPGLLAVIMELNGNGERYGVTDEALHARMAAFGFTSCAYDPLTRTLTELETPTRARGNRIYVRDIGAVQQRARSAGRFLIRAIDLEI
jgi:FkbM family methyltransferase